jgi:hypothetical protein
MNSQPSFTASSMIWGWYSQMSQNARGVSGETVHVALSLLAAVVHLPLREARPAPMAAAWRGA